MVPQLDTIRSHSYNAPGSHEHLINFANQRIVFKLVRRAAVIKLDIINNVSEKTGVSKMKAETAVEALFEAMKDAMRRGERIELRGFGVFVVKPRKRGIGRNPRTGTQVAIPEGKTIRFKPGKELQS
jgi:DNA-binding protein HU-beta